VLSLGGITAIITTGAIAAIAARYSCYCYYCLQVSTEVVQSAFDARLLDCACLVQQEGVMGRAIFPRREKLDQYLRLSSLLKQGLPGDLFTSSHVDWIDCLLQLSEASSETITAIKDFIIRIGQTVPNVSS
jgi:hypothetical protein